MTYSNELYWHHFGTFGLSIVSNLNSADSKPTRYISKSDLTGTSSFQNKNNIDTEKLYILFVDPTVPTYRVRLSNHPKLFVEDQFNSITKQAEYNCRVCAESKPTIQHTEGYYKIHKTCQPKLKELITTYLRNCSSNIMSQII